MAGIPISNEDLKTRFTYSKPTSDETVAKYVSIRDKAYELATLVVTLAPPGRETSLSITSIEEAVMWANSGIARHGG